MKAKLSIGEMAKLHQIPIKTLRYYDEIDLFKPCKVGKENGYRYYSIEQFEQLHTIKYLKSLGLKLQEIKNHLEKRDIDFFIRLLEKEKEEADKAILHYQRMSKTFTARIKEIKEAKSQNKIGQACIEKIEERQIMKLEEQFKTQEELELSLTKLAKDAGLIGSIIIGKVGVTVKKENMLKGIFNEYNSIHVHLDESHDTLHYTTIKGGLYGCIYYRGPNHEDAPKYYRILLDYLKVKGYEVVGDSFERVMIDQYITNQEAYYLTRIEIPIKKFHKKIDPPVAG